MARVLVRFARGRASAAARDGLDFALAALAYEHELSVLFEADGVGLLVGAAGDDWARGFGALRLHGVSRIGVAADALYERGLAHVPLQLAAESVDAATRRIWVGQADVIVTF